MSTLITFFSSTFCQRSVRRPSFSISYTKLFCVSPPWSKRQQLLCPRSSRCGHVTVLCTCCMFIVHFGCCSWLSKPCYDLALRVFLRNFGCIVFIWAIPYRGWDVYAYSPVRLQYSKMYVYHFMIFGIGYCVARLNSVKNSEFRANNGLAITFWPLVLSQHAWYRISSSSWTIRSPSFS